jgi:UDP-2,4-diacetamido-2,4,6-trideoxy-beta-L-altropyranose hydrolase
MNIVFRVDSNLSIGSGHLLRCLTLAKAINKVAVSNFYFITRFNVTAFNCLIKNGGFELLVFTEEVCQSVNECLLGWTQEQDVLLFKLALLSKKITTIDVLIVDHYSLDSVWERRVRNCVKKLVVIDDLANRHHCCDILIDQNLAPNYQSRYHDFVPKHCKLFLGISYLILREEFFNELKYVRSRKELGKIFVFFGGVDRDNLSYKFITQVMPLIPNKISVELVVGIANIHKKSLRKACLSYSNIHYFEHGVNVAEMMRKADLAIGAAGATTGERIFMGLPSIVYSLADNQVEVSHYLNEIGLVHYMGDQLEFNADLVYSLIDKHIKSPALISDKSSALLLVAKSKLSALCDEIILNRNYYE